MRAGALVAPLPGVEAHRAGVETGRVSELVQVVGLVELVQVVGLVQFVVEVS